MSDEKDRDEFRRLWVKQPIQGLIRELGERGNYMGIEDKYIDSILYCHKVRLSRQQAKLIDRVLAVLPEKYPQMAYTEKSDGGKLNILNSGFNLAIDEATEAIKKIKGGLNDTGQEG